METNYFSESSNLLALILSPENSDIYSCKPTN